MVRVAFQCVLVALGLASMSLQVSAWGPITHYRMTCGGVQPATSVAACASSPANTDLIVGSDLPDAFYFGEFITGSSCTRSRSLHNLEYAGYQVKLAIKEKAAGLASESFDALQYAIGFGAHVTGDTAGFYPNAYLGNGHSPNGPTWRNWISLWQFMTTVDAHVLRNESMVAATFPTAAIPMEGAEFISRATAYASSQGATQFPILTDSAVFNCTTTWSETVNRNVNISGSFSQATIEDQLVFFDRYGAQNPQQAAQHLEMAVGCAVQGIAHWVPLIQQASVTPEQAADSTYALFEELVKAGKCNPGGMQ